MIEKSPKKCIKLSLNPIHCFANKQKDYVQRENKMLCRQKVVFNVAALRSNINNNNNSKSEDSIVDEHLSSHSRSNKTFLPNRTDRNGNYISFLSILPAAVTDIGFIIAFCNFNSAKLK